MHTVNLQWPSQNLVGIGLHGSLADKYATRLTQTSPKSMPDLEKLPQAMWYPHHAPPPPMRVGREWGGMPHAPHGMGSLSRSGEGLEEVWVRRVAYFSYILSCSPIPTRFREGTCKFTVCTI